MFTLNNDGGRLKQMATGFTLVEMLAAFVLIGLMATVSLPNMSRWYAAYSGHAEKSQIAQKLQALISRCALLGQDFELSDKTLNMKISDGQVALALPDSWYMTAGQVFHVSRQAVCSKSSLEFQSQIRGKIVQTVIYDVDDKSCEVSIRKGAL